MATLTAATIRRAIATRLAGVGLREATGPLGAEMEPSTVVDRAFDVAVGDDSDAGQRVQSGVTMRLVQGYTVRITHAMRARAGADARARSVDDRHAVMVVMMNRQGDALAAVESTITYLGGTSEDRGGGAYVLTTLRYSVTYQADLTPVAA